MHLEVLWQSNLLTRDAFGSISNKSPTEHRKTVKLRFRCFATDKSAKNPLMKRAYPGNGTRLELQWLGHINCLANNFDEDVV